MHNSLNDPTIRALEDLYERLLATLLPQIISPSLQLSGSANESSVSILDAWHRLHLVRRWLALEGKCAMSWSSRSSNIDT